jgi:hypothetical protein
MAMNRGQIKVVSHLQTDFDAIAPVGGTAIETDSSQLPLIISSAAQLQVSPALPSSADASAAHEVPSDLSLSVEAESIPNYMVNISITSIIDAWEEWERGLIIGPDGTRSPSIQYLDEKFGAKWRKSDASRQRYTRRKALIQRIDWAAKNLQLPKSDVAHRIDLWRREKGMTLDKTQKTLQSCKDDPSEPWGLNDVQLRHIY